MRGVCELLDEGDAQRPYLTALELQEEKIRDLSLTPGGTLAARNAHERGVVLQFRAAHVESAPVLFQGPAVARTRPRQDEFAAEAAESIEQQARIEASDKISFDEYLARYFSM